MAQPGSQSSEFEESNASNSNAETTSSEGGGTDVPESFRNDVEGILDSLDTPSAEFQMVEETDGTDIVEESSGEGDSVPASDELLMQAGSILNGSDVGLTGLDEKEDIDLDSDDADYDDGLMSMPDPQSLMQEASGETEDRQSSEDSKEASNIADRAEDLPPPPPAPVALEEDEIEMDVSLGEVESSADPNDQNEKEKVELVDSDLTDEAEGVSEGESLRSSDETEPVSEDVVDESGTSDDELLLDNDDTLLIDDEDVLFVSDQSSDETAVHREPVSPSDDQKTNTASGSLAASTQVSAETSPKNKIFVESLRCLPLAAALALVGIGLIFTSFKNEVFEFFEHGDAHGSWLNEHVAAVSTEIFKELDPDFPYRMIWLDSDVQRVSDSEILIEARIGTELKIDLYRPVDESFVYSSLPFDSEDLSSAVSLLQSIGHTDEAGYPIQSWTRLYKHSASKGELFPMKMSYRLVRTGPDWELTRLKLKEGDKGLAWSRGRPKEFFGLQAMDVKSDEFVRSYRAFEKAGSAYLKRVEEAEKTHLAKLDEKAKAEREERENLKMALSQGSSFRGMVIAGEEGKDAREISLIITETRIGGGLIKGVLKLDEDDLPAKHFTGIFDLIESEQGVRGQLNLTTIAFAQQSPQSDIPPFFKPGTVSRIRLDTDGYRMEGDAEEVSLRLIRGVSRRDDL